MESSGSESLAPTEFPLVSSIESSAGLTVAIERCPLCDFSKRKYYCTSCVNQGLFIHSKATICQRYTDLQLKLDHLKIERDENLRKCKETLGPTVQRDALRLKIENCKQMINLFRNALYTVNNRMMKSKQTLDILKKSNYNRSAKARTHREKKIMIQKYIKKRSNDIDEIGGRAQYSMCELSDIRRLHMIDIQKYIFLIKEVVHSSPIENNMAVSTISALREASHTTYISGRWIYSSSMEGGCYSIIEPSLPNDGDYSAYILWVAANRENSGGTDNSLRNPGHTISGALTFSSQLLSVLSFLLDVRLPWRQNYNVFCSADLSERHFRDAVSRLNQNIIYLCFSQGLQENQQLDVKNALQNMFHLLQSKVNFGRNLPILINESMLNSFEEVMVQDDHKPFLPCDVTDEVEGDWEQVNEDLSDMPMPSPTFNSMLSEIPSMAYTEKQSESTLSLVSSAAASFFSAFKTNKK